MKRRSCQMQNAGNPSCCYAEIQLTPWQKINTKYT